MRDCVERWNHRLNWRQLQDLATWVFAEAVALQQIPGPTFDEGRRAAYLIERFAALGLQDVEADAEMNVYGVLRGVNGNVPAVMLSAHTDTIFPLETDLTTRASGDVVYGPGLGDNSIGVAGMLGVVEMLRREDLVPPCDIWCVATTREEGLGDLGGMKAAYARLRPRIGCVVNLEGLAFGHVYHAGIAVRRLHITASTAGGHSWLHFGRPSAVHAIMQLGTRILAIRPPQNPRTTYNIGMIEGGQAINAIASQAGLWLDMRSESRDALAEVERQVRAHIATLEAPDVVFHVQVVGDRPAGAIGTEHPLVQGAMVALAHVGVRGTLETGSTDANVPLAAGCPAVTVGVTRGGNAHRLDEYVELTPVAPGMRQLITLALAVASYQVEQFS